MKVSAEPKARGSSGEAAGEVECAGGLTWLTSVYSLSLLTSSLLPAL